MKNEVKHGMAVWAPVTDASGNIVQVTIPSSYGSSVCYVRFVVQDFNANSIVTINETIS